MSANPEIKKNDVWYESDTARAYVEKAIKFYETKESTLFIITGWGFSKAGAPGKVSIDFDGEILDSKITYEKRPDVVSEFSVGNPEDECGFAITIRIKKADEKKDVKVLFETEQTSPEVIAVLKNIDTTPAYLFDMEDDVEINDRRVEITGWMINHPLATFDGTYPKNYPITVFNREGKEIETKRIELNRADVAIQYHLEDKKYPYGFRISWDYEENEVYRFCLGHDTNVYEVIYDIAAIKRTKRQRERHFRGFWHMLSDKDQYLIDDDKHYIREHGLLEYKKLLNRRFASSDPLYQVYFDEHKASDAELKRQREEDLQGPVISVVVPTYNTPKKYLCEMIESVMNQTYSNWQLCIGDGSEGNKELEEILEQYHKKDPRVVYKILEKNDGISGNTNGALSIATGDYVGLLDHDDVLSPDALYEVAKVLTSHEDADAVYTDEDKFSNDINDHYQPSYKPDFNLDLLRFCNYITHFFVVKKSIVDEVGGFCSEFDGAQDYDFILKCTQKSRGVYHIPKVLYFWRCHLGSTALNPGSKTYAYEAGRKALENYAIKSGITYDSVERIEADGFYRINYHLTEEKVSVVIAETSGVDAVISCIKSLVSTIAYKQYDVVVVCSESDSLKIKEIYDSLKRDVSGCPDVKFVAWNEKKNRSKMYNAAVKATDAKYVLFMDDQTEVISKDLLEQTLSLCERDEVGVAGTKIYYDDDTVCHAGVALGYGDFAGYIFEGFKRPDWGKYARAIARQNYSAVSGLCMMVKRDLLDTIGGFDEALATNFWDIDFCLKAYENKKLVVFEPTAEVYTHGEKFAGYDCCMKDYEDYHKEVSYVREKWGRFLGGNDPYYSMHLSLNRLDYYVNFEDSNA